MERTFLVGLDGATFSILDRLTEMGVMPFLGRFTEGGVRAYLRSTVNPVTAQAWPTVMTGRSPGHHGMLDFIRLEPRPDGGHFKVTSARDLTCETIWSIASRHGRTVTVLNFYGLYPPQPVNGQMIAGFVPWRHLKDAVYPPELYARMKELPSFDNRELAMNLDLEKKCIQGLSEDEYPEWIRLHARREEQWTEILRYLVETNASDLTAICFDGVDKLQHACWRFLDPECFPRDPSPWEHKIRALCLHYFRRLDRLLEEIVAMAGPDSRVFVVSDHGFGATRQIFYVNVWLAENGYLAWADGVEPDRDERLTADRMRTFVNLIDWSRTRAYAVTPSSSGIFIRVGDRTGECAVSPEDYPDFRRHLAESLLSFRDPETGQRVVTEVRTREEAYPGGSMHRAPDLLLTLRDGGFPSILNADAPLRRRAQPAGTHRPDGIFIGAGSGVRAHETRPPLSILDVAPLLLYSAGLPVSEDLEGSVPEGVFDADFLAARPVRTSALPLSTPPWEPDAIQSTDDEAVDARVVERLQALGYLE